MSKAFALSKEIRATLEAYLAECERYGTVPEDRTWRLYDLAEKRLGLDYSGMPRYEQPGAEKHFRRQVKYALDCMTADGLLVKYSDIRRRDRDLRYYTPAEAERLDTAEEARRQEHDEGVTRTGMVRERLSALGADALVQAGAAVMLDLDDWERLLDLAENGKGLHR